jgi:hypothetical protein
MGLLFAIIGVLLAVYGLATDGAAMYSHSLGININLYSGVCLTVFGALMLFMALAKAKREKRGAQ